MSFFNTWYLVFQCWKNWNNKHHQQQLVRRHTSKSCVLRAWMWAHRHSACFLHENGRGCVGSWAACRMRLSSLPTFNLKARSGGSKQKSTARLRLFSAFAATHDWCIPGCGHIDTVHAFCTRMGVGALVHEQLAASAWSRYPVSCSIAQWWQWKGQHF